MPPHAHWTGSAQGTLRRALGPSEYAFFAASSDGLGDMFLHLALRAPAAAFSPSRIAHAWALLRNRHPLLMCRVDTDACFEFTPPLTPHDSLAEARGALYFRHQSKEELIDAYMNGPRTLSTARLSYLVVSSPSFAPSPEVGETHQHQEADDLYQTYHLFMAAPHFTGDGTSLHQATHDLLALLASPSSEDDMIAKLDLLNWSARLPASWESRCTESDTHASGPEVPEADANTITNTGTNTNTSTRPNNTDKAKRIPRGRFARAAARVHAVRAKAREVGGHTFARHPALAPALSSSTSLTSNTHTQEHRTILLERVYTPSETRAVLARSRAHGVTVNHVLEAVCAVAWARVLQRRCSGREVYREPVMLYTAINLRPHLAPASPRFVDASPNANADMNVKRGEETYWFLALTYFTLVLPAFLPPLVTAATQCQRNSDPDSRDTNADANTNTEANINTDAKTNANANDINPTPTTFWLRAQSAKQQTRRAVQSPLLVHRALEMAEEREARARGVPRQEIGLHALMRPMSAVPAVPAITDPSSTSTTTRTTSNRHPARENPNPPVAQSPAPAIAEAPTPTGKPPPSTALLGLSLIGNLDATYVRAAYPAFELESVTTASRQKRAGALLLVHTFAAKLWVQFFFDKGGFVRWDGAGAGSGVGEEGRGEGETDVEAFWDELGRAMSEFVVTDLTDS